MALSLTCPACHEPQTVSDEEAGRTVQCPKCRAEYTAATPAAATTKPTAPKPKSRSGVPLVVVIVFVLLVFGGVVAYFVIGWSRPTDFTDPKGAFTARFPNAPETVKDTPANPMAMQWGERVFRAKVGGREYEIMVLDGLNSGDQEMSLATRDAQINTVAVVTATNLDAKAVHQRPVTHEGHAAREVLLVDRGNRVTAMRVVVGERLGVRITVSGTGDRDKPDATLDSAAMFFNDVHLSQAFGPPILEDPVAVSAADLATAYRTDAKAADARFKDRWVRVTGPVTAVAQDGNALEMRADGATIAVQRAARARMTVQVRKGAASATLTGKCLGVTETAPETGPVIALTEAIVARPANPKALQ